MGWVNISGFLHFAIKVMDETSGYWLFLLAITIFEVYGAFLHGFSQTVGLIQSIREIVSTLRQSLNSTLNDLIFFLFFLLSSGLLYFKYNLTSKQNNVSGSVPRKIFTRSQRTDVWVRLDLLVWSKDVETKRHKIRTWLTAREQNLKYKYFTSKYLWRNSTLNRCATNLMKMIHFQLGARETSPNCKL